VRNAHKLARSLQTIKAYRAVSDLMLVEVLEGKVNEAVEAYREDPSVLYAEPDYLVYATIAPDDPDFGFLWGLHNSGQTIEGDPGTPDADIDADRAWTFWTGDPDFRIAVIDTGIDYTHPDLAANIWANPDEAAGDANGDGCPGVCGVDDDGDGLIDEDSMGRQPGEYGYVNDLPDDDDENGYADDIHGYDFHYDDPDPADDDTHGSHVAGTIGAVGDNGLGVVGVNWQCKLVALKFLHGS
jgi:subtilisin family serine protease